jgi:hypothetical protein
LEGEIWVIMEFPLIYKEHAIQLENWEEQAQILHHIFFNLAYKALLEMTKNKKFNKQMKSTVAWQQFVDLKVPREEKKACSLEFRPKIREEISMKTKIDLCS